MADWPASSTNERAYCDKLAEQLVSEVCEEKNYQMAEILVREVSGSMAPARQLLAYTIANKMLEPMLDETRLVDGKKCVVLWSLPERQRGMIERAAKKDPLRTDDPNRPSPDFTSPGSGEEF